jgi:LysM repeat protein
MAVERWLGDVPHTNTMLSPNYDDIGAGIASDGERYFFTIDTAKPSNAPVAYTPESSSAGEAVGFIIPVKAATPQPDGSIVHEVQAGQTLWAIAEAYGVDINQLAKLNWRTPDDPVYTGEELLVREAVPETAAIPPTTAATRTARPTAATTITRTPTPVESQAAPEAEGEVPGRNMVVAGAVVLISLALLVGILRVGLRMPEKPPDDPYT